MQRTLITLIAFAMIQLSIGCQSAQSVEDAGDTAIGRVFSENKATRSNLNQTPADVSSAKVHAANVDAQKPAVDARIKLADDDRRKVADYDNSLLGGKGRWWMIIGASILVLFAAVSAGFHLLAAGVNPTGKLAPIFSFIGHAFGIAGGWFGAIVNRVASYFGKKQAVAVASVTTKATQETVTPAPSSSVLTPGASAIYPSSFPATIPPSLAIDPTSSTIAAYQTSPGATTEFPPGT